MHCRIDLGMIEKQYNDSDEHEEWKVKTSEEISAKKKNLAVMTFLATNRSRRQVDM